MLNKFEHDEAVLSSNDPRRTIEEAWEQFFKQYQQNRQLILQCHDKRWLSKFKGQPSYEAADLDAEITHEAPELARSITALRRALDALEGWHISWRHPEWRRQWDVIDIPSETIPGVLEPTEVRLPRQYYHDEGWVKGCLVGPDPVGTAPIGAWIEVASSPQTKGMYVNLDEMLHVQFTPPGAAS